MNAPFSLVADARHCWERAVLRILGRNDCACFGDAGAALAHGLLLLSVFAAATARAATFTWDGGGTTNAWSDDFNWTGNVEPANDGTANIVFAATSKDVTVINQNWNINSLQFANTAPGMDVSKVQDTTLTIQANNMFAIGLTNLSNQVQSVDNDIALGGSQFWNNAAGLMGFLGDISLADHTLSLTANDDGVIFAGRILGTSASGLVKNGDGELLLSGNDANTYLGKTTVNSGTLVLGKGIFGAPAVLATLEVGDGSGGLEADKVMWQGDFQADGPVVVKSSGLADLNGFDDVISDLTLVGGRVQTGAGMLILSGNVASQASASSAQITVNSSGALSLGATSGSTIVDVADGAATDDLVIDGAISGSPDRSLIKIGAGQLAFRGGSPNTHLGPTFARGGTLLLDKNNPDAAIRGDLLIGTLGPDTAVVRLAQNNQIQAASGNEVAVGPVGILNTNGFSDAIGPLVLEGGRVTTGTGLLTVGFGVSSKASSQNAIISGNLNLNGSTQTFDIENGSAALDLEVPANIFDGGVNKTGLGTLVFRGANAYGGPTVVNGGTLLVNNTSGSGTGSGNVAVNAGATLGGNGSIAFGVSVADGGTLAPGMSVGDLAVGEVAFGNDAHFAVELGGLIAGTQYDQLIVAGEALLNGHLDVALIGGFTPVVGYTFAILTAAGNITGQFATTASDLPSLAGGRRWLINYNVSNVVLEVLLPFAADFDEDGDVDAADLVKWKTGFGASGMATHMQGDADGDHDVDGGDFLIWQKQLGSSSVTSVSTAAPEPATALLLTAAATGSWLLRRHKTPTVSILVCR